MGDYLVQIMIFLVGIIIQLYTQILDPSDQKKTLQVFAGLLIAVALVWSGYQLAIREIQPASPTIAEIIEPTPDHIPEKSTSAPTIPIPITTPADDDSVWINSHPAGADVYIIPATVNLNDLRIEDIKQANNLVGTTPLTLKLSAGNYYVLTLFPAELYNLNGYELPAYSSPTYQNALPSDGSLIQSVSFSGGEYIKDLSRVYRLYKNSDASETLISIALPLPENQRSLAMPFIYPTLATVDTLPVTYTFTETHIRNAIESNLDEHNLGRVVNAGMSDEILQVLSYVGKVVLETDSVRIIIQLNGQTHSSFSIAVYQ